jgi:hypothetical protein
MSSTSARIRVLALHSFRTNARIFEKQLRLAGWWTRLVERGTCSFTFLDAPNPASGPIPDDVRLAFGSDADGTCREWWNATQDEATQRWHYAHSDDSLEYLERVWNDQGPFDVILGFSQGAAVAALFAGVLKAKDAAMPRCIVCISGIKVRDSRFDDVYAGIADLPALHVFGQRDPVKVLTNQLVRCFRSPVVLQHDRGHVVPRLSPGDEDLLTEFICSPRDHGSRL